MIRVGIMYASNRFLSSYLAVSVAWRLREEFKAIFGCDSLTVEPSR